MPGDTTLHLSEYDLWIEADDGVSAVLDEDELLDIYREEFEQFTYNYHIVEHFLEDKTRYGWEFEYGEEAGEFEAYTTTQVPVPGERKHFGLSGYRRPFSVSVTPEAEPTAASEAGSARLSIQNPELLRDGEVFFAARNVASKLFDLEIESDRY
ncbi:MAG: hypothetical protein SVS85_01265 [Candidatus Nanohaloarchaea archaeon]|nr:hypothetical protein [Candidatus Nanohaloarchaea archaeon]